MYIPKFYEEKDLAEIEKLIHEFGFAILVTAKDGSPIATHLPLQLEKNEDGDWLLQGHMAKANPQWRLFEGADVLAIFLGPHTYVSPSWYNHKNVPTWNYKAVHAYGKVRLVEGEELTNNLRKIMARYESAHAENPTQFDEVPDSVLLPDLRALVGFEIKVERLEAASKLSQNRDAESHQNIIEHLKKMNAYDAADIAREMEKRKKS
jgi:transcriptional regulator